MPTVAIVGASADPAKFGNKSIRAHLAKGYRVFPVNPKGGVIDGLTVYRTLRDVPEGPLDRVSMYVPPAVGLKLLDEIKEVGCGELFLNPGSESDELVARAEELGLNAIVACSIVALGMSPE